jgi:hypothetical protein
LRPKYDGSAAAPTVDVGSPRKIFREALHPKAMQINGAKLRGENSALRDGKPYRSLPERGSIFVGFCEHLNRA